MPNADDLARLIIERRGGLDVDADDWAEVENVIRELLKKVSYDPAAPVFIPSNAICERLETVTRQRFSGRGLATMLARFTGVGDAWRLEKNPSNRHGRGYIWRPAEGCEVSREVSYPDWSSIDAKTLQTIGY